MKNAQFASPQLTQDPFAGSVSWQAPSNIALVKYWGKYAQQLPKNASISFTLDHCHTKTTLEFEPFKSGDFKLEVYLEGLKTPDFEPKILEFFKKAEPYLSFLKDFKFTVKTSNSFPHSSGIASSASGMSALALCLLSLEEQLMGSAYSQEYFNQKASFLARLGSGSACRSIEGGLIVWGEHPKIAGSSNLYGTSLDSPVAAVFKSYRDTVLLVDKGEKIVSSTVGHGLMHNHPFAEARFEQAKNNLSELVEVLKNGNLERFIHIVESEALSLHAMMLTSDPYFVLLKPNTLSIINHIWKYRNETGVPVCFTLDAGANVHLLYPEANQEQVHRFVNTTLKAYCKDQQFIHDQVGAGARLIESPF